MTALLLACLIALPLPPLGATLGSGTSYRSVVASTATRTELPATGLATYYNSGVFEVVVRNQIANGSIQPDACPQCIGFAALLWPGDLGRTVCVNGYGPLWVVDNAADHHRAGLQRGGWIVDIDPETWAELGFLNAPTLTTVSECES